MAPRHPVSYDAPAPIDLEPVIETADRDEIHPLRELLDSAWIPHLVLEAHQLGPLKRSRPSLIYEPLEGGYVFLVPKSLAEEAREVVAEFDELEGISPPEQ